nr:nucleotidyltransferase [Parasporobacterium sp.]
MYDMSGKFNTFYDSHVVLSQTEQTELYNKKNLNIQRLNDGLEEYNEEHETSYKVVETCVQGSVAMSTVIQNDKKEYDIDVAVVFDKDELADKGARATRNMIADALKRKTKQFNAEPEVKTSCIRVKYADGYHIDFAVYRREWNKYNECWEYEHAGADWKKRDLKGLTKWFEDENDATDKKLRKIVRLSKMFCKSRDSWVNMPSGLLQTVLCDEKIQDYYDRSDELFYYTMQQIVNRLESSIEVAAPVDNGRALVTRESDRTKMINWKNRLKSKLEDLDILFQESCTEDDA